jgi:hypothetical protein
MSLSMRAEPVAPQGIAGGFVLVPVRQLLIAWRACRLSPLGVGDFRTWLACHEMLARRCTLDHGRSPTYGFTELARLTGVSEKRARSSVNHLVGAGLLAWSDQVIGFPDLGEPEDSGEETIADTIGGGRGSLAIPRRILRLLVEGARPALIATVLAILLRCLSRGRGGFKSRGRVKSSWIARLFDVDLRRVKQARKELVDRGWIVPEPSDQWAENSWGRVFHIDLAWEPDGSQVGRRLPPPPAPGGRQLPPPDLHPEPLRETRNQEPASGGPSGVEIQQEQAEEIPLPTGPPAPAPSAVAGGGRRDPARRRPAEVAAGAGGGPLPPPRLADVRVEDLRDTGRLLRLHEQAVAGDVIGASEADRLRFVAAAEHARAIGTRNVPGLFAWLVKGRLWGHLTQDDEDAASVRLKRHLFGSPRVVGVGPPTEAAARPRLSVDALLVREVRAAMARAGSRVDPYPVVRSRDPSWTRERWEGALAELRVFQAGR